MKQKRKQQTTQQSHYESEVNVHKLNALSELYENLPSNGFSKLVVTLCLFCAILAIIVSFIMLYFGLEATGILQCSLLFFGGELVVLGAKSIFSREQTKEEIIFNEIRKDLDDGCIYDENGRVVSSVTYNTTNNYNTDTVYNASSEDTQFSVDVQTSITDNNINEETNSAGWLEEDQS